MKRITKSIVVIVGIVWSGLFLTLPFTAQDTNYEVLLGEWDVETEDGQFLFVFVFSMKEGVLTGVFQGPTGDLEMQDITFEDNELMFTVTIDANGQIMAVDFSATIEEDALEGFLSMEMGEMNFSGKKR